MYASSHVNDTGNEFSHLVVLSFLAISVSMPLMHALPSAVEKLKKTESV